MTIAMDRGLLPCQPAENLIILARRRSLIPSRKATTCSWAIEESVSNCWGVTPNSSILVCAATIHAAAKARVASWSCSLLSGLLGRRLLTPAYVVTALHW